MIDEHLRNIICKTTGASDVFTIAVIQSLWSGYGEIVRYGLKGCETKSVILKHVKLPYQDNHPRGWNTDRSHQRKIKSYQVETAWYGQWSKLCDDDCRVPHCLAFDFKDDEVLIVLEDLDESGYPLRKTTASLTDIKLCLAWLANFHATFMGKKPQGLWTIGSYWHLETRPDELQALDDNELKNAADKIDQALQYATFQSFIHGDAKLANFCFSQEADQVAAVDFQYIGGGCGMKDVAYFIGSCLNEEDCERLETPLLDYYFHRLKSALRRKNIPVNPDAVEQEWRKLYPFAWTDFHRFIKGWSPGHWKIHGYSERLAQEVIHLLNKENHQ